MFCPKCGAQNPDGCQFCAQCGETFAVQSQPVSQPVQQSQPVEYQPQQYGAQPAFNQPYMQPKVRVPLDPKKKQAIIIASVCAAVLAAFLIVLFAAIIPNSGFKGKLRHTWRSIDNATDIIDLKNNTISTRGLTGKITNWDFRSNRLVVTSQNPKNPLDISTQTLICAMSPDGRTLYLYEADSTRMSRVDTVCIRVD